MFEPGASPSKPVSSIRLNELLDNFEVVMDLNMPGLELHAAEISGRTFYGCNFSGAYLHDCSIRDCAFEMCFFDFSTHTAGAYQGLSARNCVFSCSTLEQVEFLGANLIQCAFNGIRGVIRFDDCDLLHSRFNGVTEARITIENCNVKETHFLRTPRENIEFTYANQEDALFVDPDGW